MTTHNSAHRTLKERNHSLDGLRGVAVCIVVIFHVYPLALTGGFLAVDIFFVLSGFLITSLLLQEQTETGAINLPFFYIRRTLRLFPALLLMILILLPLYWFYAPQALAHKFTIEAIFTLTYTTNWVVAFDLYDISLLRHAWSLAIEEQFYLLWPLVFIALASRGPTQANLTRAAIGFWLTSVATRIYLTASGSDIDRLYCGLDTRADAIMAGAITALAYSRQTNKPPTAAWLLSKWAHLPAIATLSYFLWSSSYLDKALYYWQLPLVHSCAALTILHLSLNRAGGLYALLCTPPIRQLGVISYGIYLWHFPILLLGIHWRINGIMLFIFVMATTISAAALSYYGVEAKLLRLKRNRFTRQAPGSHQQ